MKKILAFLFMALFVSCSENTPETTVTETVKPPMDTLAIGAQVYQMEVLKDSNFIFEEFDLFNPTDSLYIEKNKDLVSRNIDTLYLKCDNGEMVMLKNNRSDGDDMIFFDFKYLEKDLNAYIISCSLYESYNVWIINKQNADTLITINYPKVSPDKKKFICANLDLVAGFTTNGIELFKIENNKYILNGLRELSNWGPEEVMWKNDTTFVIKALETKSDGRHAYSYKALYIK